MSYLSIIYKENSYKNIHDFEKEFNIFGENLKFPYLPLMKVPKDIYISGGLAICQYLCDFTNRADLLGQCSEDKVELLTIINVLEDLIYKLTELQAKTLSKDLHYIRFEKEICPILNRFDMSVREKRWLLDYISLGDFYLYVILIQVNLVYENTYRNYFWLQKFKINVDFFLSDKISKNTVSPALKSIRNEIENHINLDNSEILMDGKIPIEKNQMRESEFMKDINYIPESLNKSLRMKNFL